MHGSNCSEACVQMVLDEYKNRYDRERSRLQDALVKAANCAQVVSDGLAECLNIERQLFGYRFPPPPATIYLHVCMCVCMCVYTCIFYTSCVCVCVCIAQKGTHYICCSFDYKVTYGFN
jgi:hypothetical protein